MTCRKRKPAVLREAQDNPGHRPIQPDADFSLVEMDIAITSVLRRAEIGKGFLAELQSPQLHH
jgi:hypothetical protein